PASSRKARAWRTSATSRSRRSRCVSSRPSSSRQTPTSCKLKARSAISSVCRPGTRRRLFPRPSRRWSACDRTGTSWSIWPPPAPRRQRELLVARDRANLDQGLHAASHLLATALRSLDQQYKQYLYFREAHDAANINIEAQLAAFRANISNFLPVLIAINDFG